MSNSVSGLSLKRKFEEIDPSSGSNKVRKIEKSVDLEVCHYIFRNHFQHIALYLPLNALLKFSQLNHFAYNELAKQVRQLDPKGTILGPIEYHRRLLTGFSFLYTESSAFKQVWGTISLTDPRTFEGNESWFILINKVQYLSNQCFKDQLVKEIQIPKKNTAYRLLSKKNAILQIQSLLALRILKVDNCGWYDNENPLLIACLLGDVKAVSYLLNQDKKPNLTHSCPSIKTNLVLNSIPHIEIRQFKKEKIINLLLDAGVNPYDKDAQGLTLLEHAAYCGDAELIKSLLCREVLPQTKNEGESNVLHLALKGAAKNDTRLKQFREILEILLKLENVNPNLQDFGGRTPLHRAAKLGDPEILKMLYSNCSLDKNVQDKAGYTPLYAAFQTQDVFSQLEIIKLLIERGEDPNIEDGEHHTVLYEHLNRSHGLYEEELSKQYRKELFDILLAASTKASLGDVENRTSLISVVILSSISLSEKQYKIEALLNAGASLNHLPSLGLVIGKAGYKIPRVLLKYGAVLSQEPAEMQGLLGNAIRKNELASIKELILFGVDLNYQNSMGMTCLHSAVRFSNSREVFVTLLEAGADPKLKDKEGKSALDLHMKKVKQEDSITQLFADYASQSQV